MLGRHLAVLWLLATILLATPAQAEERSLAAEFEELPPAAQAILPADVADRESVEVVRERYDNRRVKVEREVVQDANQNYVNHGRYKEWDDAGNVVIEGAYKHNQRHGEWTQLYYARDKQLLNIAPFNRGQLPIYSRANFKEGRLHGKWVIFDASKRKLCEWEFVEGRRHGKSTWWYTTGAKMREIHYEDGTIHGELSEWDRGGQLVAGDRFLDGQRLSKTQESFDNRVKKAEGMVLYPKLVLDKADDWEACTLATYTQQGEPVKHGVWTSWYPNGQRKLEGRYENDVPTGKFTWWHQNGQKSLQAFYAEGKKQGKWIWWHANGLKSIEGEYVNNSPDGSWLWWNEKGKVAQRADFDEGGNREMLALPAPQDVRAIPAGTRKRSTESLLRRKGARQNVKPTQGKSASRAQLRR